MKCSQVVRDRTGTVVIAIDELSFASNTVCVRPGVVNDADDGVFVFACRFGVAKNFRRQGREGGAFHDRLLPLS
jgi:hypothetical protein